MEAILKVDIKEAARENRDYDYKCALKKLEKMFFDGVSDQAAKGHTYFEAHFSPIEYSVGLGLAVDKIKHQYRENGYTEEVERRAGDNTISRIKISWD